MRRAELEAEITGSKEEAERTAAKLRQQMKQLGKEKDRLQGKFEKQSIEFEASKAQVNAAEGALDEVNEAMLGVQNMRDEQKRTKEDAERAKEEAEGLAGLLREAEAREEELQGRERCVLFYFFVIVYGG